jgi:N-acetyl-anhydromuramyl-L-alanine amidase AmpD
MAFKRFRSWHKVYLGIGLALLTAWTTMVCADYAATSNSNRSNSASGQAQSAAKPSLSAFEQQLIALRRIHQAAPSISIDRLMSQEDTDAANDSAFTLTSDNLASSAPKQYQIKAHSSNYGDRLKRDVKGRPTQYPLLIVLHETTSAVSGAVNTMLVAHPRDADQVSYHTLIRRDGTIIYLVDPLKRAYGAGDSMFKGKNGPETVQTKKNLDPSVNNFAYHISLETPFDGMQDNDANHSGYTSAQYNALAWLVAQSGVSRDRITTHAKIDQSGERQDPRSFDMTSLHQELALQTNTLVSFNSAQTHPSLGLGPNNIPNQR